MNKKCFIYNENTKNGRKTCSDACSSCLQMLIKNNKISFYLLDIKYLLSKYSPTEAVKRYKYYKKFLEFFRNVDIIKIVSYDEYLQVLQNIEKMILSIKNVGQPNRKIRWVQYGFSDTTSEKIASFFSTKKESFLIRYENGEERYNQWIEKSKTNRTPTTGEKSYFSPKYWTSKGYSEEDANEKTNEINIRNINYFIKKYGEVDGKIKYNEMREKRSESNSEENMIKKHGEEGYREIIKKKTNSLETYITKYGEVDGPDLYYKYVKKRLSYCLQSKSARRFEKKLKEKLKPELIIEDEIGVGGKLFDYRIGKYLIEVNGDWWHMNPLLYKENDIHKTLQVSAKKIWAENNNKINLGIRNSYYVIVIWEKAIYRQLDEIVDIVSNIINNDIKESVSLNCCKFNLIKENIS